MDKKRKWEQIGVRRLSTTKDLEKTAHMESNMRMKLIDFKEPVRLNFKKAIEQREESAVDLPNVLAGGERR